MKKIMTMVLMLMISVIAIAKDIKTVVFTTQPKLFCENCENRIKGNLRFLKGIKRIETSLAGKTVTISFDADKTSVEKIIAEFKKIDYVAEVVRPATAETEKKRSQKPEDKQ